jgi:3-keto-disaccharide hydrolase
MTLKIKPLFYFAAVTILGFMIIQSCPIKSYAADPAPNTLTPEERQAGWKLLFDGKTTNGWRNYRGKTISDGWQVVDGALARVKTAGDIVTLDQYDYFELSLEYKISRAGNSGIMFHVTEDFPNPWQTGPEVQILDNKEGADPQKSGWLYQLYKSDTDATKPVGQWNQVRILITPQKSEVYMNGVKYYEFVIGSQDWNDRVAKSKFKDMPKFAKASKGYIDLQEHPGEVAFRNIKIRPLPEK